MQRELERILRQANINASVTHRVKTLSSYRGKVLLKGYADPWAGVTDKIGLRVTVERVRDVDVVHEAIAQAGTLPVVDVTDKREHAAFDKFEYSGLHLDVRVPAEPSDSEQITSEIQIRTIAQDAWSVVSHKLVYKPDVELPESAKRAIVRLVALVEVFDEEVDRVMEQHLDEINTRRLTAVTEAAESNYRRFATNDWSSELSAQVLDTVSRALDDDEIEGYPIVLRDFVEAHAEALQQLFTDYGHGSEWDSDARYVLFTQPESIVILERLENAGHKLLEEWRVSGLPEDWLEPLVPHTDTTIEL